MKDCQDNVSHNPLSKAEQKSIDFSIGHDDQNSQRLQKGDTKTTYSAGLPDVLLYEHEDTGSATGALVGQEMMLKKAFVGNHEFESSGSSIGDSEVAKGTVKQEAAASLSDGMHSKLSSFYDEGLSWLDWAYNPVLNAQRAYDIGSRVLPTLAVNRTVGEFIKQQIAGD